MRGLALEGGGARGAYHIGVIKALIESGYEFDGFVGTSIGAINAAMLAQGDFAQMFELWMTISFEQLFDEEEQQLLKYLDIKGMKIESGLPASLIKLLMKIKGGGINTDKMKSFIMPYFDMDSTRSAASRSKLNPRQMDCSPNPSKAMLTLTPFPQKSRRLSNTLFMPP